MYIDKDVCVCVCFCVGVDIACPGIVLVRMPSVQRGIAFISAAFPFQISAWALLFVSDTSHQTRIRVIFQVWCVNKPIVKGCYQISPRHSPGFEAAKVFIITDITCMHTRTAQYSSHPAGHWAAAPDSVYLQLKAYLS